MPIAAKALMLAGAVILTSFQMVAAQEDARLPLGALICTTIEPAIEHAGIVRQDNPLGLRAFLDTQIDTGACRLLDQEIDVVVVDVDQRGFVLIEDDEYQWWTDAENVWDHLDAPDKLATWKKR